MKKLKNILILLFTVLTVCSCSSEDDGTVEEIDLNATAFRADVYVNPSSLPQVILDYISSNYPGQTIKEAEIEDNLNYEIKLMNETELIFDAQGNFLGVDSDEDDDFGDEDITVSNLPLKISTFLNEHFSGATVEEAERENNGNYEIELSNDVELIFDAEGNFLGRASDETENEDEDDEDISVTDLPQVIRDYIATNYPDNSILEAEKEEDGSYEVSLNNGIELEFTSDGTFSSAEDKNGEDDDEDEEEED